MLDVCEHGSLRRKCEICQRDAEILELKAQLAEKEAAKENNMQCPECGTTGMTKYSKAMAEDSEALWTCPECAWIGKEGEIKEYESTHAQRFVKMCEESINPDLFDTLENGIIPALEIARRIFVLYPKEQCHCKECVASWYANGKVHKSDCGVHNEPAEPKTECTCIAAQDKEENNGN